VLYVRQEGGGFMDNWRNGLQHARGEYLNLYDIAFDKPEAHVIAKDGKIYYAFYASEWDGGSIG